MKKLFVLATLGLLSLSSFTTKSVVEEVVTVRCHITVYSHDLYGNQYVDHYYVYTDSAATCGAMAKEFLN